jgi:hypothetical protein
VWPVRIVVYLAFVLFALSCLARLYRLTTKRTPVRHVDAELDAL